MRHSTLGPHPATNTGRNRLARAGSPLTLSTGATRRHCPEFVWCSLSLSLSLVWVSVSLSVCLWVSRKRSPRFRRNLRPLSNQATGTGFEMHPQPCNQPRKLGGRHVAEAEHVTFAVFELEEIGRVSRRGRAAPPSPLRPRLHVLQFRHPAVATPSPSSPPPCTTTTCRSFNPRRKTLVARWPTSLQATTATTAARARVSEPHP